MSRSKELLDEQIVIPPEGTDYPYCDGRFHWRLESGQLRFTRCWELDQAIQEQAIEEQPDYGLDHPLGRPWDDFVF